MPGLPVREPRIRNLGEGASRGVRRELPFRCRGKVTVISSPSVKPEPNTHLL